MFNESDESEQTEGWSMDRLAIEYGFMETPQSFLEVDVGDTFQQSEPGVYGHRMITDEVLSVDLKDRQRCNQGSVRVVYRGELKVRVPKQYQGSKHSSIKNPNIHVRGGTFTVVADTGHLLGFRDPEA